MKHTKQEILDALKVISDECYEAGGECEKCPFRVDSTCMIANSNPECWEIKEDTEDDWKAFK